MLLRLLRIRRFYICNLDYKYNDPALHNHMNNQDLRYQLRIHMLDLPWNEDILPSFKSFSKNTNDRISYVALRVNHLQSVQGCLLAVRF